MKYKLNIEKEFVDKNNDEIYKVGDKVIFDETRAEELLSDKRKLVSLNEIIKEESEISKQDSPKKNKSNKVNPDEDLKKQNNDKKENSNKSNSDEKELKNQKDNEELNNKKNDEKLGADENLGDDQSSNKESEKPLEEK